MKSRVVLLLVAAMAFGNANLAQDKPTIPEDRGEIITLPSGLKYSVLVEGTGTTRPRLGDTVKVHYSGWLTDGGELFDSSLTKAGKQPAQFMLGQVIEGWNEGLTFMTTGSRHKLHIPGALGYGEAGTPDGKIPANADLIFEVELIEIIPGKPILPKPDFDAEKAEKLEGGVEVQTITKGSGGVVGAKDLVVVDFAVYDAKSGKLLHASAFNRGQRASMTTAGGDFPYLVSVAQRCTQGTELAVHVPPSVLAQGRPVDASTPDTLWVLKSERVVPFDRVDGNKVQKLESGLEIEIIKEGEGEAPTAAQSVKAHYAGWLTDGVIFDNSFARGEPTTFPLTGVIKGWTEGLQLMKPGGIARFTIPAHLGYGEHGKGPKIRGGATLVFYIELIEVM